MSDFDAFRVPSSDSSSDPIAEPTPLLSRPPQNWNYEATVAKVEAIITGIEMGELELAEVFDQFATAVKHLQECETFLAQQQQQVDLLVETLLDDPEF